MADSHWPIVLIEGVLVLGGALAFGWWQLRSVKRDQEKTRAQREAERAQAQAQAQAQAHAGTQAPEAGEAGTGPPPDAAPPR